MNNILLFNHCQRKHSEKYNNVYFTSCILENLEFKNIMTKINSTLLCKVKCFKLQFF